MCLSSVNYKADPAVPGPKCVETERSYHRYSPPKSRPEPVVNSWHKCVKACYIWIPLIVHTKRHLTRYDVGPKSQARAGMEKNTLGNRIPSLAIENDDLGQ